MSQELNKSQQTLQKEEKLQELLNYRKKLHTKIKRKRTTVEKARVRIEEFSQTLQEQWQKRSEKLEKLFAELDQLEEKVRKSRKIASEDKEAFKTGPWPTMEELLEEDPNSSQANAGNQEGAGQESGSSWNFEQDPFENSGPPPEEASPQMKQLYRKMARVFHPDLSDGQANNQQHIRIMQQVNDAYRQQDYQQMQSLYQRYLAGKTLENNDEASPSATSVLDQQISDLEQEMDQLWDEFIQLETQHEALRDSQLNKARQEYNRLTKKDTPEELFWEEVFYDQEELIEDLQLLNRLIRQFLRSGQLPYGLVEQYMQMKVLRLLQGM